MRPSTITISFPGLCVAQSITSLFIPGAVSQQVIAFIIGSDATATTYAVGCFLGTESDCGSNDFVLTEGPSTVAYTITTTGSITGFVGCTLTGSPATAAVCTQSSNDISEHGMETTTLAATDITYLPVTISELAAASKSVSASNTSSGSLAMITVGTTTAMDTSKAGSTSFEQSTTHISSSGSVTDTTATPIRTGTEETQSSTGGADQAMGTGKAQWVVGAAVAMAMLPI